MYQSGGQHALHRNGRRWLRWRWCHNSDDRAAMRRTDRQLFLLPQLRDLHREPGMRLLLKSRVWLPKCFSELQRKLLPD